MIYDTTSLEGCRELAASLGCELVSARFVSGGRVVLCHRTEDDSWITWRTYDKGAPGFHHGHYDMTESEGRADLIERAT